MHHRIPTRALTCLSAFILGLGGSGCTKSTSDRDLELVTVDQALKESSGQRGLLGISSGRSSIWVDPRPEAAYAAEHIEGAINIPFPDVDRLHKKLEEYDVIVVYDSDYGDVLASAMSKRLLELGHDDVLTLKGGLRAWKDAGNEVEGTSVKPQ